ncbi:MAG: hypothetical protein Q4C02_06420, partial [Eubacteriales bacterium]|nr:hypothetical protein [Eubacteriales bacterium]
RVHMASLGHPIVGDRLYGPEFSQKTAQQDSDPLMLHAFRAVLRQPFTGEEIRIEATLPSWADGIREEIGRLHFT